MAHALTNVEYFHFALESKYQWELPVEIVNKRIWLIFM